MDEKPQRMHRQRGAMRSVFWLLGLAAVAVALALLMGRNQATVTLFWPPYRYDVALNFVVVALIALFALLYFALRAIAVLRDLPAQAQRWRGQQLERAAVAAVLDALSHQLAGRFVRAQAAGLSALERLNAMPAVHLISLSILNIPFKKSIKASIALSSLSSTTRLYILLCYY
jgi:HemY protein